MEAIMDDLTALSRYLAEIRTLPALSREQERRAARAGGVKDINRLVESNLGFVVKVALEYRNLGLPLDDLLSEGNLGLIEAANRFDPERGNKFITYAVWWIRKSILRALSETSRIIRAPYYQVKKIEGLRRAAGELRARLGREPSREEISERIRMDASAVDRLLQLAVRVTSLDEPAGGEREEPLLSRLSHADVTSEQRLIRRQTLCSVADAFCRLNEQQRTVLVLRLGLDGGPRQTLKEAGCRLGLSRERIRQVEHQATLRLRSLLVRKRTIDAPGRPPDLRRARG